MSVKSGIARCPRCNRTVATQSHRFTDHGTEKGSSEQCPMSRQHTPIVGDRPADYLARAYLVADLAEQIQDFDPVIVWDYLTAMSAGELQRLLVIALAGIRVDQRIDELFGWVCDLPAAKAVGA